MPLYAAGWDSRIRTNVCESQSLMPYRLAISQYDVIFASVGFAVDISLLDMSTELLQLEPVDGFEPPTC